ncbi:hypothetical protein NKH82_29515 [Mesorhizobium sp. M0915]|uniref:hypothetical protein n=1 Tax=Mesorhizobium sp. M0915 TaxID=2957027 RepID=UPI003338A66A
MPSSLGTKQENLAVAIEFICVNTAWLCSVCRRTDLPSLQLQTHRWRRGPLGQEHRVSNSLILLNLIRANRLAGLWNRWRVASTTNSKVMKSSRKSSIAWAIVSDLPLNWSSKTRALSIASTLVASINSSTLLKQSNSKLLQALAKPLCTKVAP